MPEQEIIDKLTGLVVFDQLRIEGLQGEGKENVVLRATKLDDNAQLVLKLYQSNPMFLLNEVDFDFLPKSQDSEQDEERHLEILEKLLMACESENVGLFFWHMRSIYGRILMCLIDDYKQYQMVVMDTTTSVFQNSELLQVGVESLNRLKHGNRIMDCEEWEYGLRADNVEAVVNFLKPEMFSEVLTFDKPVPLLALVFSEGFFGMIPSKEKDSGSSGLFGDLTSDSPSPVQAEECLKEFLDAVDFRSVVPDVAESLAILRKGTEQLRGMLMEDAFDRAETMNKWGERSRMWYNAGRNTMLRGWPRFERTMRQHLVQ